MDAGVDVVPDQAHPLDTVDASRRWLVGVPPQPSGTCRRCGRRRTAPTACSSGGSFGGSDAELVEQAADAGVDLVADRADCVDALACGVGELPVEVALAGEDRAGVTAAHRDDDYGGLDGVGGAQLGTF